MKTLPKLASPLLLGTVLAAACARQDPPQPAAARRAPGGVPEAAPAPWEPVDKQFTGCAGSWGKRTAGRSADIKLQPGVAPGQRTYCPVSGVVFTVKDTSPRRQAAGTSFYFCCELCAAYFTATAERVLARRGLWTAR